MRSVEIGHQISVTQGSTKARLDLLASPEMGGNNGYVLALSLNSLAKWYIGKFRFVNVSEEYSQNDTAKSKAGQASGSGEDNHGDTQPNPSSDDAEYSPMPQVDPVFSSPGQLYTPETAEMVSPQSVSAMAASLFTGMEHSHDGTRATYPAQRDSYPLGPLKGLPDSASSQAFVTDIEEACLIRHFINDLASWVRVSQCALESKLTLIVRHK